jgi:hypothetical protein
MVTSDLNLRLNLPYFMVHVMINAVARVEGEVVRLASRKEGRTLPTQCYQREIPLHLRAFARDQRGFYYVTR